MATLVRRARYVEPKRKSKNLDIRIGVTVQRLEIANGRVTGVTYSVAERSALSRREGPWCSRPERSTRRRS